MFDLATVNDVLVRATGRGERAVMLWQDAAGEWKPISSVELYGRVRALADVLRGWGVGKGDRVALLSENRWEWPVTDFATLAIGGGGCAAVSDADAGADWVHAAGLGREGGGGVVEGAVREADGGGRVAGSGTCGGDGCRGVSGRGELRRADGGGVRRSRSGMRSST